MCSKGGVNRSRRVSYRYNLPHVIDVSALTGLAARVKPSPAVTTLQEDRRKILRPQSDEAPLVVAAAPHSADTAAPPVDTDRRWHDRSIMGDNRPGR
jgi:hypothetical protein